MTKILKALLFGILMGIGIGLILSEQQRRREEIAETESFLNNPDIKAVRAAWALEKQVNEVLGNLEDDDTDYPDDDLDR